ncbi:MAG: sigma-70 family RNA polymerase sigma factor [Clostridiaceae bacterium]|nr:sigma-70 family RNA polymerase sigma factor [Clostridiaceae bacterium]
MSTFNARINEAYSKYIAEPTESNLAELFNASTPLIEYLAYTLSGGMLYEDTVQAGYEGVMKALKRYDKNMNTFATYATHCIMGEIRHHIRREMKYYKPGFIDNLQKKVADYIEEYYENTSELPSETNISEKLNIRKEGIYEILKAGLVSIDQLNLDKVGCIRYESFKLPIEDKIVLYEAIQKLSEIKKKVIYSLFFKNKTQQQTADILGINQRKVSRLLKSSLVDLRNILLEKV